MIGSDCDVFVIQMTIENKQFARQMRINFLQKIEKSNDKKKSRKPPALTGGFSFDNQITRDSFKVRKGYETVEGPHENRFQSFKTINTSVTKYRDHDIVVPFSKDLSRQHLIDLEYKA